MSGEASSSSHKHLIPRTILENALKLTTEPPTGMNSSLHAALDNFTQVFTHLTHRQNQWIPMRTSLTFCLLLIEKVKTSNHIEWSEEKMCPHFWLLISILQDTLEMCSREHEFKGLVFSLCYFHACVTERRKFGPQGWNHRYPFNNGDLTISASVLYNYLDTNTKVRDQHPLTWKKNISS